MALVTTVPCVATESLKAGSEYQELNFYFHLVLVSLNLNSQMWLVALILDNTSIKSNFVQSTSICTIFNFQASKLNPFNR